MTSPSLHITSPSVLHPLDILADIDDCISSPLTDMWSNEVLKLLPCPRVRSRWYSQVEGEEVVCYRTLTWATTELRGYDILQKSE